ncbi:hypothetical protein EVAR_30424_1 [Eumeta japonica]|uniref:Uncharacterized protein n=1 Tax=Eumeta variegata TaxID=151549 RepID=A0A4C1W5K7_EUMVA|nr:hypothetical protein EVAR_30424_1 [Eumeta japonica]
MITQGIKAFYFDKIRGMPDFYTNLLFVVYAESQKFPSVRVPLQKLLAVKDSKACTSALLHSDEGCYGSSPSTRSQRPGPTDLNTQARIERSFCILYGAALNLRTVGAFNQQTLITTQRNPYRKTEP